MTVPRPATIAIALLLLVGIAWGVTRGLERIFSSDVVEETTGSGPAPPPAGVPRITATLFYGSGDGLALVPVRQEVALAEGAVQQGQEILKAQLQGAPPPYVSLIPAGTTLRAFYVTDRGDAFVDLSPEVARNHPGGSFTELLTVHAIVNAVIANLPSIQRVQILIDGREADTLAGHIDLRRPLQQDMSLVREETAAETP
jgi:hypothetical protein